MSGIIGKKLGMVTIFSEKGDAIAGTVIEAGPCIVTAVRTKEHNGYTGVQLAFGDVKEKNLTKPEAGTYKKLGVDLKRVAREFRGATGELKQGDVRTVEFFQIGERVKVVGTSKGKGFAGAMKRHNFSGADQTHGAHESFRGTGSIGAHSYPARVFPGKKFPGHMGDARVTVKNVKIAAIDAERNLIVVHGAVPGANGGIVELRKLGGGK